MVAFVQMLVYPLGQCYDTWSQFRKENLYKLRHTGQVSSLRQALNDASDPEKRRITLEKANYERKYLYTAVERKPHHLGALYIRPSSSYAYKNIDFIVYIPTDLISSEDFCKLIYSYTSAEEKLQYVDKIYVYLPPSVDYAVRGMDVKKTIKSEKIIYNKIHRGLLQISIQTL